MEAVIMILALRAGRPDDDRLSPSGDQDLEVEIGQRSLDGHAQVVQRRGSVAEAMSVWQEKGIRSNGQ